MSTTANNAAERGSSATQAEIKAHLGGNFVRLQEGGTYFASDGTLKSVGPKSEVISIGTWSAGDALCMNQTYYFSENGQTGSSRSPANQCYLVWINQNGTAIFDPVGAGPNVNVAKPESGFPLEARFNSLSKSLGV